MNPENESRLSKKRGQGKDDLHEIVTGSNKQSNEEKPVDKFQSLKNDVNKVLEQTTNLATLLEEFDTEHFIIETKNLKDIQRDFVNSLNEETSSINRFRNELLKSIEDSSQKFSNDITHSLDALAAQKGLFIEKAEEKYKNAEQTSKEISNATLKELRLANAELSKNAARFANPTKYMNKQDVLLLFVTFILGGIITFASMSFFSHNIIDSYFQGALNNAIYETVQSIENEAPEK